MQAYVQFKLLAIAVANLKEKPKKLNGQTTTHH